VTRKTANAERRVGVCSRGEAVTRQNWKWFGNAGHFICADSCRFHMTTLVGKYLVSTVGQMWPSRSSREIHASVYDQKWLDANRDRKGDDFDFVYMQRFGYETVGSDRTFETIVFKAGKPCASKSCGCGLPSIIGGCELDFLGYNNAKAATVGHRKLCAKWARKRSRGQR